ncbi:MAG: rhodanese-like domain-containing protein [Candidatus Aenigmarchaeota archaeon]|nr:rhodanese-like domain-containing protein [Candidatus Aenigmarchaeota archaeon]
MYNFCALCNSDLEQEGDRYRCASCGYFQYPFDASIPISPKEAKKEADNGALLLDVREQYEYDITHLQDSKLIPLKHLKERLKDIPKDKEILAYCHHGFRSFFAAQFLKQHGFNARSVTGGIEAWSLEVDQSVKRY